MADFERESMLESFLYEMNQLLTSLEATCLGADDGFSDDDVNEVFRVMHTVKGASAMMQYDNLANLAHYVEDMFFYIREEKPVDYDSSAIVDITFASMDFMRQELSKIENGDDDFESEAEMVEVVKETLNKIKGISSDESNAEADTKSSGENVQQNTNINKLYEYVYEAELAEEHLTYALRTVLEENAVMKAVRMFNVNSKLIEKFGNIVSIPSEVADLTLGDEDWDDGLLNIIKTAEPFEFIISNLKKLSDIDYIDFGIVYKSDKSFDKVAKYDTYSMKLTLDHALDANYSDVIAAVESLEHHVVAVLIKEIPFSKNKIEAKKDILFDIVFDGSKEALFDILKDLTDIEKIELIKETKGVKMLEGSEIPEVESDNISKEVYENKIEEVSNKDVSVEKKASKTEKNNKPVKPATSGSQVISVSVSKLDQLLNLIRELVISESMVTHNPELEQLNLESFQKDARQLRKITNDVQDLVMSMRMVPLSKVFFKFNRIVRDMSKTLNKEVDLQITGEETEVDKNIIEHISDPLMHMLRNAIDHGLESTEERIKAGKPRNGTVKLDAKNVGSEVVITLADDGKGLNKDKILAKAKKNGLLKKDESEYSDKEIFQFIFLPGFSTNETVTSFSGRGVGMDVVTNNIISVGGSIDVNSEPGEGTTFALKIPLTLAIIDGMLISIGDDVYTVPILSIKQSLKVSADQITLDPMGNEMITVRGEVFNLLRLSDYFGIQAKSDNIEDGIVIMVENGDKVLCL